MTGQERGWIYLSHFERPIGVRENSRAQAQHYVGWTAGKLDARLGIHERGGADSARIMAHLHRLGVRWRLVRCWRGPVTVEKRVKAAKAGRRICPVCSPRILRVCPEVEVPLPEAQGWRGAAA